ncbi:MAG TPA: hypothetical protein DEA43_00555 [Candidatus Moranbacteria bacterium]|nr:hypothetical protein [Candidatus Moranbacteria bacterium]HBT45362.1 hypothetical protein [Candidatus Moranbacteria bacterium]
MTCLKKLRRKLTYQEKGAVMLERLVEINQELRMLGYIDWSCDEGLLSERALILALSPSFPREFSFGLCNCK